MKTRKLLWLGIIAICLGLILPQATRALTVSPQKMEINANKGETITQVLKAKNDGKTTETYYLSAVKFIAAGETGVPQFVEGNDEADLASWIKFKTDNISIQAGQTVEIPFTINVPKFAGSGGHYAAIFLSSLPVTSAKESQIEMASRPGALLLVKVAGEINESAQLIEFSSAKESYFSLPVNFVIRIKNTGNIHLKPTGSIVIKDMFGSEVAKVAVNDIGGNILLDQIHIFEPSWAKDLKATSATTFWGKYLQEIKNFAFGKYTADLVVNYGTENKTLSSSLSFWVMPWHVIIVVTAFALVILVILYILVNRIKNKKTSKRTKKTKG